jgi:DeoR/GlpR family transcriptional regulator of sugar metabolism
VYAYDLNFQDNLGRQVPEKLRIAQAALKLIRAGDTISISPGTTTTYLARAIRQAPIPNLTIVTNAVNIAMELSGIPQVTLVLTGGMILPSFFALVGPMAEQNLRELHTDKAFVGMHGVSSSYGLTGPNQLEALTYRAAMERTRETIVLADQTKIGQVALYRIAPITTMRRLLTAHGADAGELEQMRTLGIAVVEC